MNRILKYFPDLTLEQQQLLSQLEPLYTLWNSRINVISRQDMDHFQIHHVLFSLSLAKLIQFKPGTRIIDIGTGGGFPGIPLAIMFPDVKFTLLDSIAKKIKVVNEVKQELKLSNIEAVTARSENFKGKFDFVMGRAVTALPQFINRTKHLIVEGSDNSRLNGILYLTGGEVITDGISSKLIYTEWPLNDWFTEDYFNTKKIIHLGFS